MAIDGKSELRNGWPLMGNHNVVMNCTILSQYYYITTTTVLQPHGLCPGLLGRAGTRKIKPGRYTNVDLLEQESVWQWHQLGHMQICTLPQTDNHASIPPLSFYRPDALPATQPTASKH